MPKGMGYSKGSRKSNSRHGGELQRKMREKDRTPKRTPRMR